MKASSLVAAIRVRSVLAALALLMGAAPAYAEKLIWWEGESAKQTNFARETDFAASQLQPNEVELLSGRDWLTHSTPTVTDKTFFARYEVKVEQAGTYELWVRKFWQHGPFRWRFDQQPWSTCTRNSILHNTVQIRKFTEVDWVDLGRVKLAAGAHSFEVEPIAESDVKLQVAGLDAFVLAHGRFTPNGAQHEAGQIAYGVQIHPKYVTPEQDALSVSIDGAEAGEEFECTLSTDQGTRTVIAKAGDYACEVKLPVGALRGRDYSIAVATKADHQPLGSAKGHILKGVAADGSAIRLSPEFRIWLDHAEHPRLAYDEYGLPVVYAAIDQAVKSPEDPYREARGWVARAAHHPHFETEVPYLAYVPEGLDLSKPQPLLIHLHGSGWTWQSYWYDEPQGHNFTENPILTICPSATKYRGYAGMGLRNVLDVLEDAKKKYNIDPDRIYLWGCSMGGAGVLDVARRTPDLWAGVVCQVGIWDRPIDPLTWPPADPVQKAIELRKSQMMFLPSYGHCGVYFITGTEDESNGPSVMAQRLLDRYGYESKTYLVEAGHNITADKFSYAAMRGELLKRRRVPAEERSHIRFRTESLRYGTSGWVTINSFVNWHDIADVDAALDEKQPDQITCSTGNVASLTLRPPRAIRTLVIDGQTLSVPQPADRLTVSRIGDRWEVGSPPSVDPARKHPDRAGPLVDAQFKPMLLVYGTRDPARTDALKAWATTYSTWRGHRTYDGLYGQAAPALPLASDQQVLADKHLQQDYNLICFGGPDLNAVAAAAPAVTLPPSALTHPSPRAVCTYLRPSPYADDKYTVIHLPLGTNSTRGVVGEVWPGDWATYDPGDWEAPMAHGFFDANWQPELPR